MKRALAVTVLLAFVVTIAFLFWPNQVRALIDNDDVFKLTYQFFFIGVIGGAVSHFYEIVQHQRDVREAERGLQRKLLEEVIQAYNEAKKVRRLLRAKARDKSTKDALVLTQPYGEQMLIFLDTQLDFEALKTQAQSNLQLFPENSGVETELASIEKYLNKIVDEYETCFPSLVGKPSPELAQLPKLQEFIAKREDGTDFDKCFKDAFHRVVAALQKLIIA
jgi:hypothetical protein